MARLKIIIASYGTPWIAHHGASGGISLSTRQRAERFAHLSAVLKPRLPGYKSPAEELEAHQFNHIVVEARKAGHPVTFDDEKNVIAISGVTPEVVKAGTQWIEEKTGKTTKTK